MNLQKPSRLFRRFIWGLVITALIAFAFSAVLPNPISNPPSNRAICQSNMHEIGLALAMYSNDDAKGKFPSDLSTLIMAEQLSAHVLVCPATHDTPAILHNFTDLTDGGHLLYIYVGSGLTKDSPANAVRCMSR